MNFQIFLGFIVVCYLCYYFGTVAYDLLTGRKRAAKGHKTKCNKMEDDRKRLYMLIFNQLGQN